MKQETTEVISKTSYKQATHQSICLLDRVEGLYISVITLFILAWKQRELNR